MNEMYASCMHAIADGFDAYYCYPSSWYVGMYFQNITLWTLARTMLEE